MYDLVQNISLSAFCFLKCAFFSLNYFPETSLSRLMNAPFFLKEAMYSKSIYLPAGAKVALRNGVTNHFWVGCEVFSIGENSCLIL